MEVYNCISQMHRWLYDWDVLKMLVLEYGTGEPRHKLCESIRVETVIKPKQRVNPI